MTKNEQPTDGQSTDDLLNSINKHLDSTDKTTKQKVRTKVGRFTSRIGDWFYDHKKAAAYTIGGTVLAAGIGSFLLWNFASKLNTYPKRDVLYTINQTRFYSGGEEISSAENSDVVYTSDIFLGNPEGQTTQTGANFAKVEHTMGNNNLNIYYLKDQNNNVIASGSTTKEVLQPSVSLRGDYTNLQHTIKFGKDNKVQGGMIAGACFIP